VCTSEFESDVAAFGAEYFLRGIKKFIKTQGISTEDCTLLASGFLDIDEVILRDRWLRNIERGLAEKLILFAYRRFNGLVERHKPIAVISNPVDNFTTHVLESMAKKRGIIFISLISFYLDDRFRIASRGEVNTLSDKVERDELEKYLMILEDRKFIPSYTRRNAPSVSRKSFLRFILAYYYDKIKNFENPLKDASYNFFHRSKRYVARTRAEYLVRSFSSIYDANWRNRLRNGRRRLFVALQLTPEATIDYWCPLEMIDQERVLEKLLQSLPAEYIVIIKDHPTMSGRRPYQFYQRLRSLHPRVVLPPPQELSKEVISYSDAVCTWTSSVGIEGFFQGKKLITLGRPYYSIDGIKNVESLNDLHMVPEIIENESAVDDSVKERLLRHLLGCSATGMYQSGREENLRPENFQLLVAGVKRFLERRINEQPRTPANKPAVCKPTPYL
jgi:hypothetical protein